MSTIWGAYQFTHFVEFSVSKTGENHKEKSLVKKPDEVLTILLFNVRILQKTKISKKICYNT